MSMPAAKPSSFPHWVTWLSLGGAVLLFFGNTVPAVRERAALQLAQHELDRLRVQYDAALVAARLSAPTGRNGEAADLQSLLVAIDRLGWTPDELLRHYPETAVGDAGEPSAGDARPR